MTLPPPSRASARAAAGVTSRWSRLLKSPFDLGQNEYAAFAGQTNRHDMLIDRIGGPIGVQIGLLVALITLTGHNEPDEVRVGLAVAAAAVLAGVILIIWGHLMSLRLISVGPVVAAVLLAILGSKGGDLAIAVPALSVVVGTAVFAQRPWRLSLLFAGGLGIAYAFVLATADLGPAPVSRWVIVMTAVMSGGAFVQWIRSQVLEVVDADLEARQRAEGAARELAAVSQARSQFLARMSHHLRTPLNAVLGFTSILQSGRAGPLTDRQEEYLEDVKGAGEHLVDLVDELFDLARIEAGNPRLELAPVDIGQAMDECLRLVRERATRTGVTLTARVDRGVPRILADPRRIRQVLLNLMANAVRFTPPGGSVGARAWSDGDRVYVAVRDTGVGIAPEDQERMFDRFEQVADTAGGTGLGLSLARRFVEQHGGQIAVTSHRGAGAEFTFWLPRRAIPPSAMADPTATVPTPETELFSALIEPGSEANRALIASVGRWVSVEAASLAVVLAVITPGAALSRVVVGAFAVAALAVMAMLRGYTERAPLLGLEFITIFGVFGISAITFASGTFADLAVLGYVWLIMTAFAPWARSSGLFEVSCVGVAYAVVLALHPGPGSEVARWIVVVGVLGLNGLTVRSLVHKLRVMVFAEREARQKAEAIEEELQRAAAHKDDFVGSMSHELRTPLHAVIGFSDVLAAGAAGELTQEQRSYVDEVRQAGRELLGLIDDILLLAKLDARPPRLTRAAVALGPLVECAAGDLISRLDLELPARPAEVSVDADRALVERALTKLLHNAVQASPPDRQVQVSVGTSDGVAIVQVCDAGPGLSAEMSACLFLPFSRVDDLRGPILGLSLAQRVAAVHGGELTYERAPGTSTFTLRLPESVG